MKRRLEKGCCLLGLGRYNDSPYVIITSPVSQHPKQKALKTLVLGMDQADGGQPISKIPPLILQLNRKRRSQRE